MIKDSNKMQLPDKIKKKEKVMARKKTTVVKPADPPVKNKEEHAALKDFGEVYEILKETKTTSQPLPIIQLPKRPARCGCGGTLNIIYCPKCGRTWCSLCLRTNQYCPICGTKGV